MNKYRLLIVDDDEFLVEDIATSLDQTRYEIDKAYCLDSAFDLFQRKAHPIVITDLQMKKSINDGFVLLQKIKEISPSTAVMIITSSGDLQRAIKAMQLGAVDFMTKPFDLEQFTIRLDKIAERVKLTVENERLRGEVMDRYEMIGVSSAILDLKKQIAIVARTDRRVLITGPNGSGKELIARAIHNQSDRWDKPFVSVNCAAIPETLFESELFGTVPGAFTGAVNKKGKFEMANEGTLLLDEIGDMSLINQGKLLRVLEDNRLCRMGGEKSIEVNVRVIAATNKDLPGKIASGQFREDLFYRLNVVQLNSPALRQRRDDIPSLIEHTLKEIGKAGETSLFFQPETLEYLKSLDWPGNVRQLKNTIESLMIFWDGAPISRNDIKEKTGPETPTNGLLCDTNKPLKDAVNDFECDYIKKVLNKCKWNITEASARLDLQRTYLHDKMNKLGIERNSI